MASTPFRSFLSNVRAKSFIHNGVASITASATASRKANAGRTTLLKKAAGLTVTLPDATGSGDRYRFVVGTAASSGDYVIQVSDSSHTMVGTVTVGDSGDSSPATADMQSTAVSSDTITFDQSAGGGQIGDWVELEDIATNKWLVRGVFQDQVDPQTVFSAAV